MSQDAAQFQPTAEEAMRLVSISEMALKAQSLEEVAERLVRAIAEMMGASIVLLYVVDSRLPAARFFQHGPPSDAAPELERLCGEHFNRACALPDLQTLSAPVTSSWMSTTSLLLYPLRTDGKCIGLLGLASTEGEPPSALGLAETVTHLLSNAIARLLEHTACARQLAHLNAYLTVSSLLVQPLGLHDLLEVALYSCMEVVSAEAASVLLLDDEKASFLFYQVEGPAKPALMAATFPADEGLAGYVLQAKESEVINDVQSDPRFYERMDAKSDFKTRNMIAVPLIAGEEEVGVLEVLNKASGGLFSDEERLLLVSIAEEIAFAIRNAKMFEYVAGTYCKQRQGQMSCKGCERPLGSWTPCVKYREATL